MTRRWAHGRCTNFLFKGMLTCQPFLRLVWTLKGVMETPPEPPHALILSSAGMGHCIPALRLAQTLLARHAVRVTFFSAAIPHELQLPRIPDAPPFQRISLPPLDFSALQPSDVALVTRILASNRKACAALRSSLSAMDTPPTALITDFLGYEACAVAREFGVPAYIYFPTSAWFFALSCCVPSLHEKVEGEYVAQKEPLRLPGCRPLRPEDVVDPMMDRSDQAYQLYLRFAESIMKADGFLLNTWDELEPGTLKALKEDDQLRKLVRAPVYSVGPLARGADPENLDLALMEWLDRQPLGSVIFVSFGSGDRLSAEQTKEMAWGLERSRWRFVWVVRSLEDLPEGFSERTEKMGRLVTGWAAQREILDRPSVGGFLSHCGWNSTLESIASGVPMIAWPLHAEQKMNATMLVEEIGVALRPRGLPLPSPAAVVGREEIERVVVTLMAEDSAEGKEVRKKAAELRCRATAAVAPGGCSDDMLSLFVGTLRNRVEENHA